MKKFDIKQKISSFLLKEDGKITKKSVLKAGILLGAVALSGKIVAGHSSHANVNPDKTFDGDCPTVKSILWSTHPGKDGWHTNAAHENGMNVKNSFGRLVLGHDNCLETHNNHANHSSHGNSGSSDCCGGGIGKFC